MLNFVIIFMTAIALIASIDMTEKQDMILSLESERDSLQSIIDRNQFDLDTASYKILLYESAYK
jgi:hypothetical protein